MELYQLKTFVRIADEGSLTRAAEQLFTSQPAISAQLKALEEELGVTLFTRTSRGMQLTDKGRVLYEQARETLQAAARLKTEALALQQELVGEVKIGVHTDFDFVRVGELHRRLAERHPRIQPHFVQSMSSLILPDIRRGQLDAGFFFGPCTSADLLPTALAGVPMRIVGPAEWGPRITPATLQQLAAMSWVYTSQTCPFYALAQRLLANEAGDLHTVAYVDSEDAVRELIRAGAGLSLLREDDARRMAGQGDAVIWPGDGPTIELGFAVHHQRSAEPLIRAVREVIVDMWGDIDVDAEAANR
ncbi:MAG: LysR family transcriptional regulator [Gammaproteobacteria bacterium]|nr:LysR family transcriptional regulator [Gammaproteobacteria bacterium]